MVGKAMFQLKTRLERNKITQINNSLPVALDSSAETQDNADEGMGLDDAATLVDEAGNIISAADIDAGTIGADTAGTVPEVVDPEICSGKLPTGNRQTLRARFGRKRTHNEELCVTTCGIILGRATFYGSESPSGIIVRASSFCLFLITMSLNRSSGRASFLHKHHFRR